MYDLVFLISKLSLVPHKLRVAPGVKIVKFLPADFLRVSKIIFNFFSFLTLKEDKDDKSDVTYIFLFFFCLFFLNLN